MKQFFLKFFLGFLLVWPSLAADEKALNKFWADLSADFTPSQDTMTCPTALDLEFLKLLKKNSGSINHFMDDSSFKLYIEVTDKNQFDSVHTKLPLSSLLLSMKGASLERTEAGSNDREILCHYIFSKTFWREGKLGLKINLRRVR